MSESFLGFARACGLDLLTIKAYDKIQRCPTFAKPKHQNGAYLCRSDGNGWCIAYDGGGELQWFDDPAGPKAWSEAEKAAWVARKRAAELEERRKHDRAVQQAEEMIRAARPGIHGYLMRKGFESELGLVLPDGSLMVPMRNLTTNALQGAQLIRWLPAERRWEKKYSYGSDPKLAVMRLGAPGRVTTILCEGYATGLSILAAAKQMHLTCAVLVCFNDGNIVRVAHALENAPFARCVFADHDDIPPHESDKRDRGDEYEARGPGELAAVKTGLPYAMAPVCGDDANDHHQKHGLLSLCGLVMKAIRG